MPDPMPGCDACVAGFDLLDCGVLERQPNRGNSAVAELAASDRSEDPDSSVRLRSDWGLANRSPVLSNSVGAWSLASILPFYLIGLLLAATAIAKLWMLLTDSFADIRVGIPREILWLSVAFELWLAYENFRIRDQRVLAFINTTVFGLFAVFASIRWLLGYGSCGCSGNLELPAWIFVLLDLGIVAWFTVNGRGLEQVWAGLRELSCWWRGWSMETRGRFVGMILFVAMILVTQLPFAAPLRAKMLGEPPVQAIVRIEGDLIIHHETTGQVELWNHSSQHAEIVGMSRSCRCFNLNEIPILKVIPANARISLPLIIKPEKIGPLHQRVALFLDHPKQFQVNVDVVGSVLGVKK